MPLEYQKQNPELLDNIFASDSEQDWREDFNSVIEREVKYRNLDADKSDYLGTFLQNVLRAELAVMMDEHYSRYHFLHFLETQSDAIIGAIQRRLAKGDENGRNKHFVQKDKIRYFLNRISHVFKAKLARGEDINASEFLPVPKPENPNKPQISVQKKGRGKAKKARKPKSGRRRPIMGFESIAEASRKTGESYQYLQKKSLKAYKDENKI